jgi:hypothetical protein
MFGPQHLKTNTQRCRRLAVKASDAKEVALLMRMAQEFDARAALREAAWARPANDH